MVATLSARCTRRTLPIEQPGRRGPGAVALTFAFAAALASPLASPLAGEATGQDPAVVYRSPGDLAMFDARPGVVDASGRAVVPTAGSDVVYGVLPDGTVEALLTPEGSGAGVPADGPIAASLDAAGNIHVVCAESDNVFRIAPDGTVSVVLEGDGDSVVPFVAEVLDSDGPLHQPWHDFGECSLASDGLGNLYVASHDTARVFRVAPDGEVELLMDGAQGVPAGVTLLQRPRLLEGAAGEVFILSQLPGQVLRCLPGGSPQLLADSGTPIVATVVDPGTGDLIVAGSGEIVSIDIAGVVSPFATTGFGVAGLALLPTGALVVQSDFLWEIAGPGATPTVISFEINDHVTVDGVGNLYWEETLFVFTTAEQRWLRRTPAGVVSELIVPGESGALNGVTPDPAGGLLITRERSVHRVDPSGAAALVLNTLANQSHLVTPLTGAQAVAWHPDGALYVSGDVHDNVVRVDLQSGGTMQVLEADGDGRGNTLDGPRGLAVLPSGDVVVAGSASDNVFRVAPDGSRIEQVLDASGDGLGHPLDEPRAVAADSQGNVFAAGFQSNTVFRVAPGGAVELLLTQSGDGLGHPMSRPVALAVDGFDNLYVAARATGSVHRVSPLGVVTSLLDANGDGVTPVTGLRALAVSRDGTVHVSAYDSDAVFRVTPQGAVSVVADPPLTGGLLHQPQGLAVDRFGSLYATGDPSASPTGVANVLRRDGGGQLTLLPKPLHPILPGPLTLGGADETYLLDTARNAVWRHASPPLWDDLGGGIPGAAGTPRLDMRGPLTPGSAVDRVLVDAPPNTLLAAWISITSTPVFYQGGTIHAFPKVAQVLFASDALGESVFSFPWPGGFAPSDLFLQFLVADPSVPGGIGLSNAIMSTIP